MTVATPPLLDEFRWLSEHARAPRLRTMEQFAEEEMVLPPTGRYGGRPFRCDRQPFTRLWLREIDSGRWRRHWCTGPTQSGKTTTGSNLPVMYHLFERRETVIYGLPSMELAKDKWEDDIRPAIEACPQFRDLLPLRGGGSKGGATARIEFRNGAILRFMSAGGGDKTRAGKTTRALVMTEVDGFDEAGSASRESDKVEQMEARLRGWDLDATLYAECTLSTEQGRTFQEITNGSNSKIVIPCPHCGGWVTPEREHVQGWQDAEDEIAVQENAHWCCPDCGKPWTEDERLAANHRCKLVHRGQEIGPDGVIHGPVPRTYTLGFRWGPVNNLLMGVGTVALDLWKAQRAEDEENAEKKLCQFVFAEPYRAPDIEVIPLKPEIVQKRMADLPRGVVPDKTQFLTVGSDMHRRAGNYVVVAWQSAGRGHIVDYGQWELPTDAHGIDRGTLIGLRDMRDQVEAGWGLAGGGVRVPDAVWIDSGWADHQQAIYAFCREAGDRYRPIKGHGASQRHATKYVQPTQKNNTIRHIGDGYHLARQRVDRNLLVHINVDRWKTRVHDGLSSSPNAPGALTLFRAMSPKEHWRFAMHMTSERWINEFKPGIGNVQRWETVSRNNHWLDALVYAAAAGHFCGVRLIDDDKAATLPRIQRRPRFMGPDGQRPFLVTERSM